MDIEITRKVFLRFLKVSGVLRQFVKNFSSDVCCKIHIESTSPLYMLSNAFVWLRTPQGHDYWKVIDEKWVNLLLELSKTRLKNPLGIDRSEIIRRAEFCQYNIGD